MARTRNMFAVASGLVLALAFTTLAIAQGPGGNVHNDRCCQIGTASCAPWNYECYFAVTEWWDSIEYNAFPGCADSDPAFELNCTEHDDICNRASRHWDTPCTAANRLTGDKTELGNHCDAGSDPC